MPRSLIGWPRWLALACLLIVLLASATTGLAAVPTPAAPPSSKAPSNGSAQNQSQVQPAPQSQAPAPPPPAPPSSVVAGVVLLDEDLDGSPSRGDRPLVGVAVQLVGPGISSSAVTGGNGSFVFGGLPAGSYTVSVGLPAGVVPRGATSQVVTVDGHGSSARADFFVGRPERIQAVETAQPTATPRPLPTPVPAPGSTAAATSSSGGSATSGSRQSAASRPIVTSLQGIRYAPGGSSPSQVQPVVTERAFWLGVPFITQLDGTTYAVVNCGPASTAMALAAFGVRTTPANIRDYVNYLSGVYGRDQGTSLVHLARITREAGLEVSNLYVGGGFQRWSIALLRQEISAGHPVVTLVKYRALPGHGGAVVDWDHYIVISGVAGDDFIYNDAAYSSERGYGLLISPGDLQRAWDYSSIPRHGMAVSLSAAKSAPDASQQPAAEQLSAEAQLEAEGLSLGDEVVFTDSYGALLFARLDFGSRPAETTLEGSLELGDFLDGQPGLDDAESGGLSYAGPPGPLNPLQPVARPVSVALPTFVLPLVLLAVGLGLGVCIWASHRALE